MKTLEEQLENAFTELEIEEEHRVSIKSYLNLVKINDQATYEHSIRVGLIGIEVAKHMHLDPKVLFYSGMLHDVGKCLVDPETLKKTEGFDKTDMKKMTKHSKYSYDLLRGVHEFSAEIALRHHKFQENGYPKTMPIPKVPYKEGTKVMINFYARILGVIDFYDAITTRKNDKFGEVELLDRDKAKSILLSKNQDQRYLIEDLYTNEIFS
ncbi:HD-GYP domain-containing protein [Nanoarchaeota archaeon]